MAHIACVCTLILVFTAHPQWQSHVRTQTWSPTHPPCAGYSRMWALRPVHATLGAEYHLDECQRTFRGWLHVSVVAASCTIYPIIGPVNDPQYVTVPKYEGRASTVSFECGGQTLLSVQIQVLEPHVSLPCNVVWRVHGLHG